MLITLHGLYLSRNGHRVGIVQDRGAQQAMRWVTTRGYYVTSNGSASLAGGKVSEDLVQDITPSDAQVAGMDSMLGSLR